MLHKHLNSLLTAATLCQASVIVLPHARKVDVRDTVKPTLTVRDEPSRAEIAKREEFTTDRGTIVGTTDDSLYTFGLATCAGMTATGNVHEDDGFIDKALAHIRCDDASNLIEGWKTAMRNADMSELSIAVSVVNPALIEEGLRDAQKELNRAALVATTDFVQGELWRVQPVERQETEGSEPLGSIRINADGSTLAEGNPVSWPAPPTLDVSCFWPVLYTPTNAPQETVDAMHALADQICKDANGCTTGTPHCVTSNEKPLGYCVCV